MNQQNMPKTPSSSTSDPPVKRKRGRPRKDENMSRNDQKRQTPTTISPSQPPPMSALTTIQPPPSMTMNPIGDNHNMVGQVVTGVIDGVFDAGYLLSVRVGPNNTLLRGLVFQQGHFCPITQANDMAPHLKMSRRENFQIPTSNQNQLCTSQSICAKQQQHSHIAMPVTMQNYHNTPMITGGSSNCAPPPENLRMMEQDEFMQVFEVSKMVQEPSKNDDCNHRLKNDHLVSDTDLMAESLPRNDVVNHQSLHCGASIVQDINHESVQDINHESIINESDKQKLQGENSEPKTGTERGMEEPPSFEKEILQQENEIDQEGEMSKIDVNQDPNDQGVATDLFQTN